MSNALYHDESGVSLLVSSIMEKINNYQQIVNQLEITEDDIAKMESPQVKKTASTQKKKAKEVEKKIEEEDIDLPFFVSEEEVYHS